MADLEIAQDGSDALVTVTATGYTMRLENFSATDVNDGMFLFA